MSGELNKNEIMEEQIFNEYREKKDKQIRDQIFNKYKYMADILARKFSNRGIDYDDLYQVACIGLLQAIERFDIDKNVKFQSFATPTIIGEIKKYFRDKGSIIRVPRRLYEMNQKINHARQLLSQQLGKVPKVEDIARYLNIPEETILEVIEAADSHNIYSLDNTIKTDEEAYLQDFIGVEDPHFIDIENKDFLDKSMKHFNDMEKEFIKQRYYKRKTQSQIASAFGVSQMYISRLEKKVIDRFRRIYSKNIV